MRRSRRTTAVTALLRLVSRPISAADGLLLGTQHHERLISLGAVLAGEVTGRADHDDITLFCSVGLAGTETYLRSRLL